MKNKICRRIICILLLLLIIILIWIAICGYLWSWGPFASLHNIKTASLAGNQAEYSIENVSESEENALNKKKIIFLGSSVTYGAAAQGVSFVDYIEKRDHVTVIKEAVSGTTLVDEGIDSYISRMEKIKASDVDLLVCQLSTNDATQKKELGKVSDAMNLKDFDTHTVAGAMEYIIVYAKENWDCPVVFYTNPKYDSEEYQDMVDLLLEIQEKWKIEVIDLWNDTKFNEISEEQRYLYMADEIHPTQAGYLEWWTPYFEEKLKAVQ